MPLFNCDASSGSAKAFPEHLPRVSSPNPKCATISSAMPRSATESNDPSGRQQREVEILAHENMVGRMSLRMPGEETVRRHKSKFKLLAVFAFASVVGIIGFVIGSNSGGVSSLGVSGAGQPVSTEGNDESIDSLQQAKRVLSDEVLKACFSASLTTTDGTEAGGETLVPSGPAAALRNITPPEINSLIDMYEQEGDTWDDPVINRSVVDALKAYRDEALLQKEQTADRLRRRQLASVVEADQGVAQRISRFLRSIRTSQGMDPELYTRGERELRALPELPTKWTDIDKAWSFIEGKQWGDESVISNNGRDKISVDLASDGVCWMLIEETEVALNVESLMDWLSNFDLGKEDLLSTRTYQYRDASCGCKKKFLWWCHTYNACETHVKIGTGYDGFTKAYNGIRLQLWERIQEVCGLDAKSYNFVGWSRGAAIAYPVSFGLVFDKLLPKDKVKTITFGSPRALDDATSDIMHEWMYESDFRHYRVVVGEDLFATVPFDWMGFKHAGDLVCIDCPFPAERDRPFFALGINTHLFGYCEKLNDLSCDLETRYP